MTQPAFEIVLLHNGAAVTLRASLRAAVTLDSMTGGIAEVWDQISRLSWSAIRGMILATATDRQEAHRFLAATADKPLCAFLPDAQAACLAVLASYQAEPAEAAEGRTRTDEVVPLRAYLQSLYDYATGWLGWTPAETWATSPAELEAAFTTHINRLVKMTPGLSGGDNATASPSNAYTAERLREIEELGYDPAFDRAGFDRLKAQQNG